MNLQLSGKIYWVLDDFGYKGNRNFSKKDETAHTSTKVKYALVQDHMIKFSTEAVEIDGEVISYNINLLINDRGTEYTGTFSEASDADWNGDVSCELFENKKAYFLYGNWVEDEEVYTWWARIDK
ncbi:MAG: hypothetical protein SH857_07255 [Chitinophagales bacterium]|nr:hypothetical protein [Chitinophagales bacterium]